MEKKWYDKFHHLVDFLIPVCLVLLIVVLVIEFGFSSFAQRYHLFIIVADGFIVLVFFLDVVFKYQRASSIPNFLKDSWLDIIAIFPFFLFFRVFEGVGLVRAAGEIAEVSGETQRFLHTGVEVEKEIKVVSRLEREARVAKEVEIAVKEGARSERLVRFLRPILRTPRLLEAVSFYEKPGKLEILEKKNVSKRSRLNNKKSGKKKG